MSRRSAIALGLLAAFGCQDYNFNPVPRCLIQPGNVRRQLADISVADVLFVVDDSNSMDGEQANLARNFGQFIDILNDANADRKSKGLKALEYHIAITTSSVFRNETNYRTCQKVSGGTGSCCVPQACAGSCTTLGVACGSAGQYCTDSPGCVSGQVQCAAADPKSQYRCCSESDVCDPPQACSQPGAACGDFLTKYRDNFIGCSAGSFAAQGAQYPAGGFVNKDGNAKVLHFTRDMYDAAFATTPPDFTDINALAEKFKENVIVGSCGSGQEQHFKAGKLAVEKFLGSKQAGVAQEEWLHPGAKLVVIWIADEDDCSVRDDDPKNTLVLEGYVRPDEIHDSCMLDETFPLDQQKHVKLTEFRDYFHSLGRPFAAGFIVSTQDGSCADPNGATCTGGVCACQESPAPRDCGGVSQANRFIALGRMFREAGDQVVVGTVCDREFSTVLQRIAQLVVPINALQLPNRPEAHEVTVLRILNRDGGERKQCVGPARNQGEAGSKDWWFVDCADKAAVPSVATTPTTCIHIRDGGGCGLNPGESYVAEYLGTTELCNTAAQCAAHFGGRVEQWACEGGTGLDDGTRVGACICATGR